VNTTYHYVVLRLATDGLRGELINAGVVLFSPDKQAQIIVMATLNKFRAIDASWDGARLGRWIQGVQALIQEDRSPATTLRSLAAFGYCDPDAVGSFMASSKQEIDRNLAEIKATYVANRAAAERAPRQKKTRLHTALREQFKRMHVLGSEAGDLIEHLVVPNVPVPDYPELKTDFVYKNGTYRITQAIDYHVAPDSLHNKLAEACVKTTAAELAMKAYGSNTLRLAVLDIPEPLADATDAHVDLLIAQGFEVFHFGNPQSLADYLAKGAPVAH
jgi:hypothetical protein